MPQKKFLISKNKKYIRNKKYKNYNNYNNLLKPLKDYSPMVFRRFAGPDSVIQQTTADLLVGQDFRLTDVQGYTELTNLFQEYMITKVEIYFYPKANVQQTTTTAVQTSVPFLYFVFDPNDASAPGNLDALRECGNCQLRYGYNKFKLTYYPRVAQAVYDGAFTGFATGSRRQWIDTSYPSTRYFGLKYGISGSDNTSSLVNSWVVNYRYTIACRRVK